MEKETGRRGACSGTGGVKTELECLPCFFRQISRSLNYAGVNGDRGRGIDGRRSTMDGECSGAVNE